MASQTSAFDAATSMDALIRVAHQDSKSGVTVAAVAGRSDGGGVERLHAVLLRFGSANYARASASAPAGK